MSLTKILNMTKEKLLNRRLMSQTVRYLQKNKKNQEIIN